MKISFPLDSVARPHATQYLLVVVIFFVFYTCSCPKAEATAQELLKGFEANPDPSVTSFQPILNDPTDTFSFGFLRVNSKQLSLTVVHVPSSELLWQADPTHLASWSDRTRFFFNGSLVVSDPHSRVFWSTGTQGDRVVLLNTSNLQIEKLDKSPSTLWQSFDFPTNTLVENQNFTSTMSLVSSNGRYSMRLGNNFIGLYAKFNGNSDQIYWRHRALEAKAEIIKGKGPLYARINADGYLGMYQIGSTPVDVESFSSYHKNITGFLRLRLEPDGNLKAYYWDGSNWVLDYQAISETCELPSPCGSYGLCRAGSGCSCLDNRTDYSSSSGECAVSASGDLCHDNNKKADVRILRRNGVDLPFKELISYKMTSFLEQCEDLCANNCSCWGALYNNASGFCYMLDYPIQTLIGVGDQGKMGYFKVRPAVGKKKINPGFWVLIAVLSGALFFLILAVVFGTYRICTRRRRVKRMMEEDDGVSPGPYKNLGSDSFRSIEMSNAPR